jgi:hypothetical protein
MLGFIVPFASLKIIQVLEHLHLSTRKRACTPLPDEAIHRSGVKVGVGTPNCCHIPGFQKNHDASWADTLSITDRLVTLIGPMCDLYMISHCIMFSILQV